MEKIRDITNHEDINNLGQRIRNLRKEYGMTQRELASTLGFNQVAVHYWETGKREPDLTTLKALTDLFDVDYNYLLDE